MTHAPMLGSLSSMLTSAGTSVKPQAIIFVYPDHLSFFFFSVFHAPVYASISLSLSTTNQCLYGMVWHIADWQLAFALYTHTYNDIKERGAAEEKEKSERGGQAKAEAAKHPSFH